MGHFFLLSKNLTWRDIQHLIVQTSSLAGLIDSHTVKNGVGRTGEQCHNDFYITFDLFQFDDITSTLFARNRFTGFDEE